MNNLEELKQELKNLEKIVNELKEKLNNLKESNIEKTEEENNYKRVRVKEGEKYWSLGDFGDSTSYKDLNDKIDNFNYRIGNYFKTKEQAENYKEKLLIEQELRDVAMELNKGEKIDWDDVNQEKISLGYNFPVNSIQCSYEYLFKCQDKIYCLDKNFKDVAIERIGEERLAKYLKGELD